MVPDIVYDLARYIASALVVGAIFVFLASYLRRVMRHKSLLRTISIIVLASALLALLFVKSPLDYHSSAPARAGAQVFALSQSNDLIGLHAADGSQAFIRHLPDPKLQDIVYDVDGLLIVTGISGGVVHVTHGYECWYPDTAAAIRAFHRDDGRDALPKLGALKGISASTVDHGVLYVVATDDSHPDADVLYAFLLRTGEELWHQALSTIGQSQIFGIDHGMLYIWLDATVAAVRVTDGALLWQRALTTTPQTPHYGATYYDGMFYAGMLYIWLDATVAAIRVTDGALIWQSSPLVKSHGKIGPFAPPQGDGVYVRVDNTSSDVSLVKLDARDDSKKWTLPGVSPSAISGNRLYGIQHSKLTAFDTSTGAPVWQQQGAQIQSIDYSYSNVTASEGVLYVVGNILERGTFSGACMVFAIRMSDHAELWRQQPHTCDRYTPSLLEADGMLYYRTRDGDFTAFRVTDGAVLWTHTGYSRGGMFTHWTDTFGVEAVFPGIVFIDSDHAGPCALIGGCDPNYAGLCRSIVLCDDPDVGHYLEAVDPATGRLYWRYRVDDSYSYIFDDGAA